MLSSCDQSLLSNPTYPWRFNSIPILSRLSQSNPLYSDSLLCSLTALIDYVTYSSTQQYRLKCVPFTLCIIVSLTEVTYFQWQAHCSKKIRKASLELSPNPVCQTDPKILLYDGHFPFSEVAAPTKIFLTMSDSDFWSFPNIKFTRKRQKSAIKH